MNSGHIEDPQIRVRDSREERKLLFATSILLAGACRRKMQHD